MKKILYLDNWDKGYRHFLRLDATFKERGCNTLLVHTRSWMGEDTQLSKEDFKVEQEIDGMLVRDITYYKTNRLRKIITAENPDAIIMLNLSFIIDRAIIRICKDLNIKIYFLAHGRLHTPEGQETFKENMRQNGEGKLTSKFTKKNRLALYNYFIEMRSVSKFFGFFPKAINDYTQFTVSPRYSDELNVTKCFVYYPGDFDVMVDCFGFPKENIEVVGNPELDFFYNTKIKDKATFCKNELGIDAVDYVAYTDDGLSSVRNWDNKKWMAFIDDINNVLIKEKLKLVIKLHPRRQIKECETFLNKNGIKYFYDLDFKNYLHHSLFTICHFSSVIVYALLLDKKVKSPRWGLSEGIEKCYPEGIVYYYNTRSEFEKDLLNLDVDTNKVEKFLDEVVTYFDGKCIDRIVDEILKDL